MRHADLSEIDRLRWAVDQPPGERIVAAIRSSHYPAMQARLRAAVVRSHAVVFDKAASAKTGEISNMGPEVMLHLLQSARLPWDSVIVQIDRAAFWKTANAHWEATGNPSGASMGEGDGGLGTDHLLFLIQQINGDPARIQCLTFAPPGPDEDRSTLDFLLEPLVFNIDVSGESVPSRSSSVAKLFRFSCSEHLLKQAKRVRELSKGVPLSAEFGDRLDWTPEELRYQMIQGRDPLDLLILGREFIPDRAKFTAGGRTMLAIGDWPQEDLDYRVRLAAMAAPVPSPYAELNTLEEAERASMLRLMTEEILGVPRMVLCILTALGISGGMVLTDVRPRGHRMVGNRRCPYLATSRIVIDLAHPMHTVRPRLEGDSGQHRRAHEVRGFWRYYRAYGRGGRPGCAHHWDTAVPENPEVPIDRNRQACIHCAAKRTWIPQHQRGDASLGYVHHDAVEVTDTEGGKRRRRRLPLTPPLTQATYEPLEEEEKT